MALNKKKRKSTENNNITPDLDKNPVWQKRQYNDHAVQF